MLTYDEIVQYIQKNKIYKLTPYQGSNGIGVVYEVEIEDYGKCEPRLATFDNIQELARFAEHLKFCDRVTTDKRDLINSEPQFLLRGKIITPSLLSAERKKEKTLLAARKEYSSYSKKRGQILIKKIEAIQTEIAELEKMINEQSKKGILLFKSDHEDDENKSLPNSGLYNIDDLPLDRGTISRANFVKLKITYEKLKWQREILNKKIEILREFSQKGFLKKLLTSQKDLENMLNSVDSQSIYSPQKQESDIFNDEMRIDTVLSYLDRFSIVQKNPTYYLELLNFLKSVDSQSLDTPIDSSIEQEFSTLDNLAKSISELTQKEERENSEPSKEDLMVELFTNLKDQFDKNLTDEQKDALIIYNSQFFMLIGEISNIPDYETMTNQDILAQLQNSPNYESILKSLHSHCMTIQKKAAYNSLEFDERLDKILTYIFPGLTPERLLTCISIQDLYLSAAVSSGHEDEFSKIMCEIIEKMKTTIKTIHNIPQDAVVLPEDLIVYRGIDSTKLTNPQSPSKGTLMSTTLNPHTASRFGGEHPSIYKIHLSKGSPVQILPNKVYCGQDAFQRYIRSISPDDKLGSKEIMVDTQKMQQFEITESISPITHYQFENDEFVETKDGFIITGDMEPLIIQNVKDVYDREEL